MNAEAISGESNPPKPTKRRGRPPTGPSGQPMSARKRKELQRERDEGMIWELPIPDLPDRALLLILGNSKFAALQRYAWEEIGRRRGYLL